jgi:hypothetical protein
MTTDNKPERAVGQQLDYPAESPHARCWMCQQPRTPLFWATDESHNIDRPAELCARCWSKHHADEADRCPHCGRLPDDPGPGLW